MPCGTESESKCMYKDYIDRVNKIKNGESLDGRDYRYIHTYLGKYVEVILCRVFTLLEKEFGKEGFLNFIDKIPFDENEFNPLEYHRYLNPHLYPYKIPYPLSKELILLWWKCHQEKDIYQNKLKEGN